MSRAKATGKTGLSAVRDKNRRGRSPYKAASESKGGKRPAKTGSKLTKGETGVLAELEGKIGSGLASFVEVGRALKQINAGRLYREAHETFEDYCEQRWDLSRQHGYRLIHAAESFDLLQSKLPKGALLPRNESQLRPLENLKPELLVKVWKQVIKDSLGVKVTAEAVEKAVRALGGSSKPHKPVVRKKLRAKIPTQTVERLVSVADKALRRRGASVSDLRGVLENIRDQLRRLTNGTAS